MDQEQLTTSKVIKPSERLLKGLSPEERDKFERSYGRAKSVLTRINEYASAQVNLQSQMLDSPKGFETPNWAYLQAWYAGYRQAMRVTQDLTRIK